MSAGPNSRNNYLINGPRLWDSIMDIARIGATDGQGSCRLSLSDGDREARDLFAGWVRDSGLDLKVDAFGNMFAIRPGRKPDEPIVLMGSHLDTQPHGGRFDGVVGVLAGLEVLRAFNDKNIQTVFSVGVANWTNEEGVRFKPGLTGSKGYVGALNRGDALITGQGGDDFFSELCRIGYDGVDVAPKARSYHELHIEQGPVLELARRPLGLVLGIQGVRWFEITVTGVDAHAGTTPMQTRSDSFMASANLVIDLQESALRLAEDIRFTVGRVEVSPNSQNTVPGLTRLGIDVRHENPKIIAAFDEKARAAVQMLNSRSGITATILQTMDVQPVRFDQKLMAHISDCASKIGIDLLELASGAMHDASSIAMCAPAAMIFIQSRNGISHNPAEWSDPENVELGCELLARAIIEQAC